MHATSRRKPIVIALLMVGATMLFAGCGDSGAHLPAGSSSVSYATGGTDAVSSILGGDPGPANTNALGTNSSLQEDPILAGYDGTDSTTGLAGDDPFAAAGSDWDNTEGSMSTGLDSSPLLDAGMETAGYGYGGNYDSGYGSGYGYGSNLGAANYGGSYGGYGSSLGGYGSNLGAAAYGGVGGFNTGGIDQGGIIDDGGMDIAPLDTSSLISSSGAGSVGFAPPAATIDSGMDVGGGFDTGGFSGGIDAGAGAGFDTGGADINAPAMVF